MADVAPKTDPFSINAAQVIARLLQNPQAVSNVQLQWLRKQYAPNDYMQGILAPYEHQAFAREVSQEGVLPAASQAVVAIPAYQAAKGLGLMGSRTGFQPDQAFAGWQGVLQGLRNYFGASGG